MTPIRFLDAGESHGPAVVAIIDGLPAGLRVDLEHIKTQLGRRRRGLGAGPRMRIEDDAVIVDAGLIGGQTIGAPVAVRVENRDHASWREADIAPMTIPRPGHADLVGAVKYGHADLRLSLERASARETVARVAVGALCEQLLVQCGVEIGGYVRSVGASAADLPLSAEESVYRARFAQAETNDLGCPDPRSLDGWRAEIASAMKAKDTLGGVVEVFAVGVPVGLGSYAQWDRRLDGAIGQAMLSIPAMKGVEIGDGFASTRMRGTQVHDPILVDTNGALRRPTNAAGGLEAGVSNGVPLVVRVAMKPLSTTLQPLPSVDLLTGKPAEARYERSDFCAVARAVPVVEAMLALTLANALLDKVGGDSVEEIVTRVRALRRAHVDALPMGTTPWRWDRGPAR